MKSDYLLETLCIRQYSYWSNNLFGGVNQQGRPRTARGTLRDYMSDSDSIGEDIVRTI